MRHALVSRFLMVVSAGSLVACASAPAPSVRTAPGDVETYRWRVERLSSASFEGRAPGSAGIERAADYLGGELAGLGLEPYGGGRASSWRLPSFEVSGELVVEEAVFAYEADGASGEMMEGEQFNVMGVSGNGEGSGTLAFVGYGIEEGPGGYDSFGGADDLSGKVVVLMRFEPLDEKGESLWAEEGEPWTTNSYLLPKFEAVLERNPEGVIFVAPPGVDDERAGSLPTARSTRFGERADVPVVAATVEAVDRLVQLSDHEGRTLMDLRRLADRGEAGVVELSAGRVRLSAEMTVDQIETSNVAGVLPGRGSLADEWVIIGAHYDHLGMGEAGRSRAPKLVGKAIHPGADDNASGTAGVLHAARVLRDRYDGLPAGADARSVLFLFFSAEEMGLLGSKDFVARGVIDPGEVVAMLNMDMIGRLRNNTMTVYGVGTAAEFDGMLEPYWEKHGLRVKTREGGLGPSDHASFYRGGMPVLAFFTGIHDDYHTPGDTADKVNMRGGTRIAGAVADIAYELATRGERLAYVEIKSSGTESPRLRSRARLGFMPGSYDETERGAVVGDVLPGSPAAEAGLEKGDRIIAWNGEELANIFGYMQALSGHKPGDRVTLGVERGGEVIELKATLGATEGNR